MIVALVSTHLPYWLAAVVLVTTVRRVRRAVERTCAQLEARAAARGR